MVSKKTTNKIFAELIFREYERFYQSGFENFYVEPKKLASHLDNFKNSQKLKVCQIGSSLEGRSINKIVIGNGPANVLLWSQMHGDESTATRAILDILNFFEKENEFDEIKQDILEKITITIIPMLNPDGAKKFTRRNAQQIDLNRDAVALQSPEANLLFEEKSRLAPGLCLNLHDQENKYSVGFTNNAPVISFLATTFNTEKDLNESRKTAMKIIAECADILSDNVPGHISRYDDMFEPRGFGDNFALAGIPLILIESGWWKNDFHKEYVRKLNFVTILSIFRSFAKAIYNHFLIEDYSQIPENVDRMNDLIIRNVRYYVGDVFSKIDISIKHKWDFNHNRNKFFRKSIIADLGDLSTQTAEKEVNLSGYRIFSPKVSDYEYSSDTFPTEEQIIELIKSDVMFVRLKEKSDDNYSEKSINILNPNSTLDSSLKIDNYANLIFKKDNAEPYYLLNGELIKPGIDYFESNCLIL
ncbi:MAG: hypothetical protein K9G44_09660 [Melioribacteraceae bacterium]|nr:hypothetical protein [Melioribacteraceae bacterium]